MGSEGELDAPIRAIVDTSVLMPPSLRADLQRTAMEGGFTAIWSPWIVTELNRVMRGVPWYLAGEESSGNGAAMRAAPLGLAFWGDPGRLRADAVLCCFLCSPAGLEEALRATANAGYDADARGRDGRHTERGREGTGLGRADAGRIGERGQP